MLFLISFSYQNGLNERDDRHPGHWDLGVFLTGLDLHDESYGYPEYGTLGLARTNGLCHEKFSCVITEFGVANKGDGAGDLALFPSTYPTTGFSAVYGLAHEIGHTFGLRHDGFSNDCGNGDFIMSQARSSDDGATQWSECSAKRMAAFSKTCLDDKPGLDRSIFEHRRFRGRPGMYFGADSQCKLFLMDTSAVTSVRENDDVCKTLRCAHADTALQSDSAFINEVTGTREVSFSAGPALDGTECEVDGFCLGGDCVHKKKWYDSSPADVYYGKCNSACLERSMGVRKKVLVYDRLRHVDGKND